MSDDAGDPLVLKARQALYWRLLGGIFDQGEVAPNLEDLARGLADQTDVPTAILDPEMSVDMFVQRFPALKPDFERPLPGFETPTDEDDDGSDGDDEDDAKEATSTDDEDGDDSDDSDDDSSDDDSSDDDDSDAPDDTTSAKPARPGAPQPSPEPRDLHGTVKRTLVTSKLLLNAFGPNTQNPKVSATQYNQWTKDVGWLERCLGLTPGSLRGQARSAGSVGAGAGEATRPPIGDDELRAGLQSIEADMIHRMDLREVLADRALAEKLTPSMALVEQLLWDKDNLSKEALANAKRLIKKYVDELAQVLKLQVRKAITKTRDDSVPPRRIFRNLDLKRTVWKNLTNWDPERRKLYVDRLYYVSTAKKSLPTKLIILVDQSGSMTAAMVQTTILASIFAGLPNVIVHLFAYDTRVIDLTPWVDDPVETLLRTKLGGGTTMRVALDAAEPLIDSPANTAVVVISDYYDWSDFFSVLRRWKESGVRLIPVGSLQSSGYFSVDAGYRERFKELGTPILNGSPKKLIEQIKKLL
ncbi:vWA domain-containing protein [Chondromyces crocatus]|uniref:VWA containing CoxE family protein n=1 Tax=Chondromyces crocatus TaxID=52 RepID=A0A0K1ER23_CHOCO|nr:VWA domain-containing protein [Chondromyces crocatus]AKT43092.1 VWA containing CoxE family protein [Chondromyces crocatus]